MYQWSEAGEPDVYLEGVPVILGIIYPAKWWPVACLKMWVFTTTSMVSSLL